MFLGTTVKVTGDADDSGTIEAPVTGEAVDGTVEEGTLGGVGGILWLPYEIFNWGSQTFSSTSSRKPMLIKFINWVLPQLLQTRAIQGMVWPEVLNDRKSFCIGRATYPSTSVQVVLTQRGQRG